MPDLTLDEFLTLRISQRCQHFIHNNRLLALVYAQQLERPLLESIFSLADAIRGLSQSKDGRFFLRDLLPDRRAMLYFTQPSTRTFLSFSAACQILGMSTANVRDPATSSESQRRKQRRRTENIRSLSRLDHYATGRSWIL